MHLFEIIVNWVKRTPADDSVLVNGPFILGVLTWMGWAYLDGAFYDHFAWCRRGNSSTIVAAAVITTAYIFVLFVI